MFPPKKNVRKMLELIILDASGFSKKCAEHPCRNDPIVYIKA